MIDVARALPEDPDELRAFTQLLLAEVKSQAMLIEKLRHQLSGHRTHRFGSKSESIAGFTNYRTVISVIRGQPFH